LSEEILCGPKPRHQNNYCHTKEILVFWDMTPSTLRHMYLCFKVTYYLLTFRIFYTEGGGSRVIWNFGTYLPGNMASDSRNTVPMKTLNIKMRMVLKQPISYTRQ